MAAITQAIKSVHSLLPKTIQEALPMSRSSSSRTTYSDASSSSSFAANSVHEDIKSTGIQQQSPVPVVDYSKSGNSELSFLKWANSANSAHQTSSSDAKVIYASGNPELAFLTWPNSVNAGKTVILGNPELSFLGWSNSA